MEVLLRSCCAYHHEKVRAEGWWRVESAEVEEVEIIDAEVGGEVFEQWL